MRGVKIETLLKLNNFRLVRKNKHLVWKDPAGNTFVMSTTPSDMHAFTMQRQELARTMKKIGKPFITEEPIKLKERKEMQHFNTPRIADAPKKHAFKLLDDEANRIMIEGRKNHWPLKRITKAITDLGYRSATGREYNTADISRKLADLGHRKNRPYTKGKAKEAAVDTKKSFMTELTEIITSNLSEDMKERMAIMMLKSRGE